MSLISADSLRSFRALADRVNVGIIAIADKNGLPIVFVSKLENILGYTETDLLGKTFARLLPVNIRPRHKALMESFKEAEGSDVSRGMNSDRTVQALHKDGSEIEISVSISYHQSMDENIPGLYLAFIQDPLNLKAKKSELHNLKLDFNSVIYEGKNLAATAKKAIAKKVAASGGVIGFIVWILTQITPLGTAIKAAVSAFKWGVVNEQTDNIGVYRKIDDEERSAKLREIETVIRRYSPKIIGVAYYRFVEYGIDRTQLRYVDDSGLGEEIWYYDMADNNLILTDDELRSLKQQDCILKRNGGFIPSRKDEYKFNVIFCPTIEMTTDPTNPTLKAIKTKAVVGLGVDSSVNELEPYATLLWRLAVPNLENINP